jgi:hypothetical protein
LRSTKIDQNNSAKDNENGEHQEQFQKRKSALFIAISCNSVDLAWVRFSNDIRVG